MDTVYYKDDMVTISLKIMHWEVPRYVICVAIPFQSKELALHVLSFVLWVRHIRVLLLRGSLTLLLYLWFLFRGRLATSEKNLTFFFVHESDAWFPTYSRDVLFIVKLDLGLEMFIVHPTSIKQIKVLAFFDLAGFFLCSLHESKFPGFRSQFFLLLLFVTVISTKPWNYVRL